MTVLLRHLEVSNLAGIDSAVLDFRAGLNVFYGPNELGKSSLVEAMRAALLLQDSSTAASALVDWHTDAPPQVMLEFETERERIWRVRKSFGSGRDASSYLEFSRDGQTFTQEAKGREVDGRLQELLHWGIEAPGAGARRRRGIPESFITNALLGAQDEVTAILGRSVADDPDESGKQRLTEALQAIAVHPLFKQILDATQAKVDEAFSPTGKRRSGRSSPWVQMRDELKAAKDRQAQVKLQLEESESARLRIEGLQQGLLEAHSRAEQATDEHKQLGEDLEKQRHRLAAQTALEEAEAEVSRIQALFDDVRKTEESLGTARTDAEALRKAMDAAEAFRQATQVRVEESQSRVRELESGSAEQQRRLREQEIEKELLTFTAREKELGAHIEQAKRVGDLQGRINAQAGTLDEARSVLADAQESSRDDEQKLEGLGDLFSARCYLEATEALVEAQGKLATAQAHSTEASELRAQANAIREEVADWHVPSAETLAELRKFATERQVTEAKLKVGLTVTVAARSDADLPIKIEVSIDDERPTAHEFTRESQALEAAGRVRLEIADVADIDVRAGTGDLHAAAGQARDRWESASEPVFAETGWQNIDELETLQRRGQVRLNEAQETETKALEAAARAESVEDLERGLGEATDDLEQAEATVRERLPNGTSIEVFIENLEQDGLSAELSVEDEIEELSSGISNRRELAAKLRTQVTNDEGQIEKLRGELAAEQSGLERLLEDTKADHAQVVLQSGEELEDLRKRKTDSEQELESVRTETTTEVDEARGQLVVAQAELAEAETAAKGAKQKTDEALKVVAELEGGLGVQRTSAEREDPAAAKTSADERASVLGALPEPEREVDEGQYTEAGERRDAANEEVRSLELTLRQAEGALEQVGGQYIEEQDAQAREAVEAITEREHQIDADYGAWNLLRETLMEAETEDAVHLGNALVGPVSERMSALTGGRYGELDIGPQLQTEGIEFGGERRDHASLSLGTQEQLATLLRLSIAEALDSFIVMDDQLTQSDPERMEAIRDMLRTAARNIQVIVFTCRPDDYLTEGEGERVGVGTQAVDLTTRITR